jgi:hypothetical protein
MPSREDLGGRGYRKRQRSAALREATNSSDTSPAPTLGRSGITHGRQRGVCRKPIGLRIGARHDVERRIGLNQCTTTKTTPLARSNFTHRGELALELVSQSEVTAHRLNNVARLSQRSHPIEPDVPPEVAYIAWQQNVGWSSTSATRWGRFAAGPVPTRASGRCHFALGIPKLVWWLRRVAAGCRRASVDDTQMYTDPTRHLDLPR